MIRSRGASYALLAATLWLPLYFVLFLGATLLWVLGSALGTVSGGGVAPAGFGGPFAALMVVHLATIVLSLVLVVVYVLDVLRNPSLSTHAPAGGDSQVLWLVLVVLTGMIGMIVYWVEHLRPGTPGFEARLAGTGRGPRRGSAPDTPNTY